MAAPFTPGWVARLGERAAGAEVDADLSLILEQRIEGEPTATYHVAVAGGRVVVEGGSHPGSDVVLTTTREVALAIHDGTLPAQRAFLDGGLRVDGDTARLIRHRGALAAVASALSAT